MVGAIITFVVVCVVFGIYMSIVHKFLRAAEDPEDVAREERLRGKETESPDQPRQPQWAH